jgi:hypothetical protein
METNKDIIENILKRSSEHKAPKELSIKVLDAWKTETQRQLVMEPLISKKAWIIISASFMTLVAWAIANAGSETTPSPLSSLVTKMVDLVQFDLHVHPIIVISLVTMAVMTLVNVAFLNNRRTFGHLSIL